MSVEQSMEELAHRYQRFAELEAQGRSKTYYNFALHVAQSDVALRFLLELPEPRRQPNLFFAAMRVACGLPPSAQAIDDYVLRHSAAIQSIMLTRTTQTNEAARCAVLLPVIAQIKGPIALIEIGASAGLCLLMDHYAYDWGHERLAPDIQNGDVPQFKCASSPNLPVPNKMPNIVWRAGLDLNPLSVTNKSEMEWLEALIWPEHQERQQNLQKAISVAQESPPQVHQGDLTSGVQSLFDQAPKEATLVVFHSAVLAYVSDHAVRDEFAQTMLDSGHVWLSNEGAKVFPQFSASIAQQPGKFLLAKNGEPMAWTGPHGQSIAWIAQ